MLMTGYLLRTILVILDLPRCLYTRTSYWIQNLAPLLLERTDFNKAYIMNVTKTDRLVTFVTTIA
jgi:hypothetical protein